MATIDVIATNKVPELNCSWREIDSVDEKIDSVTNDMLKSLFER